MIRNLTFLALALGLLAHPVGAYGQEAVSPSAIIPQPPQVKNAPAPLLYWPFTGGSHAIAWEEPTTQAEQVVVTGSFDINPVEYPALPEVEGTKINSGKKTSFVKPEEFPVIANNDYREAMATTPGILVSEEPTSPIVNFGYRGLDSQRSEFMQILKDGVSIKNEQFGFPESHYAPTLDAVERIEFVRGGAALQFGPQPGGALNFIMKMPRRDAPFHFTQRDTFGSDELFTNFTAIETGWKSAGFYGYYDHREREGFRETNGDYIVDAGSARAVLELNHDSRIVLTYDAYEEEHGEPGGLRRPGDPDGNAGPAGSITRFYEDNRDASTRLFDRFRLSRHYGVLDYQKLLSDRTQLDFKAFGGYLERWSKRQRGGGEGFQPDPTGAGAAGTNDVQARYDWTEGADARLRHDYDLFNDVSTFAGGLYFYHALQHRDDRRGPTPDAEDGELRRSNFGETFNGSIFAENRFHFGRFSITPGMRLEFFQQSLEEEVNITKVTVPLGDRDDFSFVPLFGIGTSYILLEGEAASPSTPVAGAGKGADYKASKNAAMPTATQIGPPRLEIYGNFSQAYRPRTYGELVATSATGFANPNLEEGHSLQGELGLRGKPLPYLNFDLSGFWYGIDDLVAEVGDTFLNAGDVEYWGFEAAVEFDVLAAINSGAPSPWGKLNLYGNVTVLDAEFTRGAPDTFVEGNTPAYAPNYQFKTGAIYHWKDRVKVSMLGNLVDKHFSNADNGYQHFIPSYDVWDLTAEVKFWEGRIGVFAGIKNLFDRDYWAEVRDEGILPAYRRNYYGGFEFFF
ncbi:MAG TPA: TonB-dependent receptor plug domain-containing protein [Chthoniobacterales bacterium]|nr:TonB-dependent receptor plug domain-containing protein [Chthoniobacterales bacterium]